MDVRQQHLFQPGGENVTVAVTLKGHGRDQLPLPQGGDHTDALAALARLEGEEPLPAAAPAPRVIGVVSNAGLVQPDYPRRVKPREGRQELLAGLLIALRVAIGLFLRV